VSRYRLLFALCSADNVRGLRSLVVKVLKILEVVLVFSLASDVSGEVGWLILVLAVVPLVFLLLTIEALGLPSPLLLLHRGGAVDARVVRLAGLA